MSGDLGLKSSFFLFRLTLRLSDLDFEDTHDYAYNVQFQLESAVNEMRMQRSRLRVNKIKARAPGGPPRQRIESSFPLAFKMVFDSF